jgi:hypothetical protein
VKVKVIAVTIAAASLSLGMAGSAGASLGSQASPAPQVTGVRLQSALLPASAFGGGITISNRHNSGSSLRSTQAVIRPSNLSCARFAEYTYIAGFGNTAGAVDSFNNPSPALSDYPSVILGGDQAVLQFGSASAATSFYNRAYARYKQCSAFTEPDPADNTTVELTTQSLSNTTIGNHKAFQLIQNADLTSFSAFNFYEVTAVVLAGANVYVVDDLNGTNDPISASLLSRLISRVQALYRH